MPELGSANLNRRLERTNGEECKGGPGGDVLIFASCQADESIATCDKDRQLELLGSGGHTLRVCKDEGCGY